MPYIISHMLVVEDDMDQRELIKRVFEVKKDIVQKITFTSSLQEAREVILSSSPDIIMTDLFLLDGIGTDLINQFGNINQIPLIVLTCNNNESNKKEALKNGVFKYLCKTDIDIINLPQIILDAYKEWHS